MLDFLLSSPVLPQCILLGMVCVILLFAAFFPKQKYLVYVLSQVAVLLTAWACTMDLSTLHSSFSHALYADSLAKDSMLIVLGLVFVSFLFVRQYNLEHGLPTSEFYILSLLSTLGMMVLVGAANMLTLYLGIELMSLPLYALVALKKHQSRSLEAAFKYFIIGAVATGILLFGLSFLFSVTGSIQFDAIKAALLGGKIHSIVGVALILILVGLLFKMGAVPFHSWVADVYDGAPNSVTLFLSSAPKVAVMVVFIRLLEGPLWAAHSQWLPVLEIAAVLSIILGNLSAIVQTSLKRMLAYSSIAHTGYALLGLCAAAAGNSQGFSWSYFYIISYALMSAGGFGALVVLSRLEEEVTNITDLVGLSRRQPLLAFMMLLLMFSMAGIPPLVGFIAKVTILNALISAHLVGLAVVAIVFSIIGAYYYIRVVKAMYFDTTTERGVAQQRGNSLLVQDSYAALIILGGAVLLIGLFPSTLMYLCQSSFGL